MLHVYADGGVPNKGGGTYWQVAINDDDGQRILVQRSSSRVLRTSGEAECAAIRDALHRIAALPEPQHITVFSDCKTLLKTLKSLQSSGQNAGRTCKHRRHRRRLQALRKETVEQWEALKHVGHRIVLQWVPRETIAGQLGH